MKRDRKLENGVEDGPGYMEPGQEEKHSSPMVARTVTVNSVPMRMIRAGDTTGFQPQKRMVTSTGSREVADKALDQEREDQAYCQGLLEGGNGKKKLVSDPNEMLLEVSTGYGMVVDSNQWTRMETEDTGEEPAGNTSEDGVWISSANEWRSPWSDRENWRKNPYDGVFQGQRNRRQRLKAQRAGKPRVKLKVSTGSQQISGADARFPVPHPNVSTRKGENEKSSGTKTRFKVMEQVQGHPKVIPQAKSTPMNPSALHQGQPKVKLKQMSIQHSGRVLGH